LLRSFSTLHWLSASKPIIARVSSVFGSGRPRSFPSPSVPRPGGPEKRKPFLQVCGRDIRVYGRLIRIARLDADQYEFLDDPEPVLDGLRRSGTRVDLFTFMQRLPETSPKHRYPMEWDNLAVVSVSTFEEWWTKQIGFKARNKAKQAEKKGVTLREAPFDDALVHGIWKIYNECRAPGSGDLP
jgi:hypothetical protein